MPDFLNSLRHIGTYLHSFNLKDSRDPPSHDEKKVGLFLEGEGGGGIVKSFFDVFGFPSF